MRSTVDNGRPGEQHVGHILPDGLFILDFPHDLADARRLSREDGLVHPERARGEGQDPAVRWDLVPDVHRDDVTGDELCRVDLVGTTGTDDGGFVGGVFLEGL